LKKLAYVVTQSEMGGAQKNILLLSKGLSDKFDITVYCGPGGLLLEELRKAKISAIEVPFLKREVSLLDDLKTYCFLVREFREKGYSIVHSHSSKAGLLARLAARKARVPKSIYTAHGFVFNEPMGSISKAFYRMIEKYAASISTDLIVVSRRDLETAESLGIQSGNQAAFIPNGIDFLTPDYRDYGVTASGVRQQLGLKDDDFVFGCIANFYETKGHRYLVRAFEMLRNRSDSEKLKLVLVGQGSLKDEIRSLSGDGVIFTGYVENAEKLMKAFDCLILSSVKEGFPFVVLEAVRQRLPIVATDVGDINRVLSEGDFESFRIVDPGSSEALNEAMEWMLENAESARIAANRTYEMISERYSLQRMLDETLKVYER